MKIGFISTYFYPVIGGAENNCFYLARELAKRYEVHVFTSDRKNNEKFKEYEVINNIHVHRCKTWFRYRYYFAFYPSIISKILRKDLDILHVHSLGFFMHDFCVIFKKLFSKTKIVNTPHGPPMTLKNYNFIAKFYRFVIVNFEKLINKLYDLVIQVNPSQKKWMVDYGINKNKIEFIPNGISKELFKKENTNDLIKKYKLNNKLVISYLGRLEKYKGIDNLIEAFNKISNKNKLKLVIIGQDLGDKKRLMELVKKYKLNNYIIFTGRVNEKLKLKLLNLSKIFILPSEWEAFGISILEAMAKGNSIISTKTEGGLFLVKEGVNGYLYDFGDVSMLRNKIQLLIKNKKLRYKIGLNNIKKAKEFLWEDITMKLEEKYEKLLKEKI